MFGQFLTWTEIPLPLVINPIIGSPGTGVQHLANFTSTSSSRSLTLISLEPLLEISAWLISFGLTSSSFSFHQIQIWEAFE